MDCLNLYLAVYIEKDIIKYKVSGIKYRNCYNLSNG